MWKQKILILGFLLGQTTAFSSQEANLTRFMDHRQKRGFNYGVGSAIRFSVTGVWPINLEEEVNWRQAICLAGLQSQYTLPAKPVNPFDPWIFPPSRSLRDAREEFDRTGHYEADPSRMFVYAALEQFMDKSNKNGRQCVLRSICENAQVDQHHDVNSRLLDVILTPGKDDLDQDYRDAMKAGEFGVDCFVAYPKCPYGDNFLDPVVVVTS